MSFLVTTTGAAASITLDDLGGRTITHPTVDLDLSLEYALEELRDSSDLKDVFVLGYITVTDGIGNIINEENLGLLDELKVAISDTDDVPNFLEGKLTFDLNKITLTKVILTGEDETLKIGIGVDVFDKTADDTDDVNEGVTNLYHTNVRVDDRISLAPLDDLADVEYGSPGPISEDILKWNGTNWVPVPNNAASVTYDPIDINDWLLTGGPINVEEGLDELADRLQLVQDGGGIDVDAQQADASDTQNETSTEFVDVPDLILTTGAIRGRRYLIIFSGVVEVSPANKVISFQITIDGVPETASLRTHTISSAGASTTLATHHLSAAIIESGLQVKIQWKINSGSATIKERALSLYSVA